MSCSLCRVELVVQFPLRGSTQVLLCLFADVLWLLHFLYSVGPHPVSSLHICTLVVSRAFMAGAASQAGNADSSQAPCLASGLQGSVVVHRGALLLVPQWQCISSFVFYIKSIVIHENERHGQLDMCLRNTDDPGGNKVKILQKSPSHSFWPRPTPRGRWCQWSVKNPKMNLQSKFG